MYKILVINPGSTSTKIAVFGDEEVLLSSTVKHSTQELQRFSNVIDQYEFRRNHILEYLAKEKIDLTEINVVVGRGGLLRPLQSGVYEVNERMINDLRLVLNGEHASNLGAILAQEIAYKIPGCKAFIADPVVVDELQDVARISGLPQFPGVLSFILLTIKQSVGNMQPTWEPNTNR